MQEENKEPVITLSDLINLCRRNQKKILRTAICVSLLACFWTLTNPVYYWSEGTFRDKGSTDAGMRESFNAALVSRMSGKSMENEATTTMKSRTILKEMVKRLHLNGSIHEVKRSQFNSIYLSRLFQHLYTEYRLFFYRPTLFFEDSKIDVAVENIEYEGEEPYGGIQLVFTSDDAFQFSDQVQGITLQGSINTPIVTDLYAFTIARKSDTSLTGKKYNVQLRPYDLQVAILGNSLKVKADKEDKTLVHIESTQEDRHIAAQIVNTLMDVYQDYKKEEIQRIAGAQLDYLSVRHSQINEVLERMMSEHAQNISKDLLKIGFPNAQSAIDFLSSSQSQQQQRLLTIDLETRRLEQALDRGYSFFDNYTPHGDPGIINHTLAEIRELKKQSDNLQLTLHQNKPLEDQEQMIENYVSQLEELSATTTAAEQLLSQIKAGTLPEKVPELLDNSKFLIKSWWNQLSDAKAAEREKIQFQFVAYLEQLIRLFEVNSNTLIERLTRQQNPMIDFEGIDLASARELYINYSKQLNEVESQTIQHEYILGEIQHPDFEVTSLSSLLTDPVSHEMITQTSRLSLQLNETHNRSAREQQRIREEIAVKKGFLAMHLKNATQLLQLRQNLVRDKIRTLQETTLALLQQQISLLEKHLSDYLVQRIRDLKQERDILIRHQLSLNTQMSALPNKLAQEKIIDQQLRINTGVAEEVSRLIESKNLASNLEVSRSIPVEIATPPIKPKSPKLLFFAIFGAFLGAFFHVSYLVARTMLHGMPVSRDNLALSGYHVSGTLTCDFDHASEEPLRDSDLETLRNLGAFLPNDGEKHSLFVCENQGPNFSHTVAKLLAKRDLAVLLLHLSFDQQSDEGLLQYLVEETTNPSIQKGTDYDTIVAGGISRFSNELISSKRFKELLTSLKEQYDWVIGVSHGRSMSAETKDLLTLFDFGVFAVTDQTLQELPPASKSTHITLIVE